MKIFYRFYVLQVFLTITMFMVPSGTIHWIATALLALLMLLLWFILKEGLRKDEAREQAWLGIEPLVEEAMRQMAKQQQTDD